MMPADITVSTKIKKIVIVNRSLPQKESTLLNLVEGLFSNEGVFVDRLSSGATIDGANQILSNLPRYQVMTSPQGIDLRGIGSGAFTDPLPWSTVEDICNKSGADALITLEVFDSDVFYKEGDAERKKTENNKEVKYLVFWKEMDVAVKTGWRIYDPKTKIIVDQSMFTDHKRFRTEGLTKGEAAAKLPKLDKAVVSGGKYAGELFAYRISPNPVWVDRQYYKKGTQTMLEATRNAKIYNWDAAIDLWRKNIDHPDPKIAGRACYNMALGAEINGNLQEALQWTDKAFTRYNIKSARNYSNQLNQRIRDKAKLDEQMQEN